MFTESIELGAVCASGILTTFTKAHNFLVFPLSERPAGAIKKEKDVLLVVWSSLAGGVSGPLKAPTPPPTHTPSLNPLAHTSNCCPSQFGFLTPGVCRSEF